MERGSQRESFAEVLAEALRSKNLTLSSVRDALAARGHSVSLATLSYWRSGQREPERVTSLAAIPDLEALLGLSPEALSGRLQGRQARRSATVVPFSDLVDHPIDAAQGEASIGRLAIHLVIDIDAEGRFLRARHRQVLVSERDGATGMTMFTWSKNENGMVVDAIAGCTLQEVLDLERGVKSVWLNFDRPLPLGESTMTEIEFRTTHPEYDTDYNLVAEQCLEEAVVWVRFDPSKIPSKCWVYFKEGGLGHAWPVTLGSGHTVHYRQTAFGPGLLGVRWEW